MSHLDYDEVTTKLGKRRIENDTDSSFRNSNSNPRNPIPLSYKGITEYMYS